MAYRGSSQPGNSNCSRVGEAYLGSNQSENYGSIGSVAYLGSNQSGNSGSM